MYYGLSKIEFGISILLSIYVLGSFDAPIDLLFIFKSPFAAVLIFGSLIYMFYNAHVIVTVLYIFAIYELLKRANEYNYDDILANNDKAEKKEEAFFNMIEGLNDDELEGLLEGFNDSEIEDVIEGFNDGELEDIEGFENDEEYEDGDSGLGTEGYEDQMETRNSLVNPADVANAAADVAESTNLGAQQGDALQNVAESENLAASPSLQQSAVLQNTAAAQSQLAAAAAMAQGDVGTTDTSGGATVTEAFTQLLGINSLEREIVNNMAPVGLGTRMNYKTTPYVSSSTDVKGASLI